MSKIILKNKLLATTAICAISMCANTVKAEEIDILSILNNSTTKSPNISWEKVTSAGENTIQIGDEYFKYTWTNNDSTRGKYYEHQEDTLSGNVISDFIGIKYETSPYAYGGAIYNEGGKIDYIIGDFIGNSATGSTYTDGGAIYNGGYKGVTSKIGNIVGNFIGNSVYSTNDSVAGGAIYNVGDSSNNSTIDSITGDFISNSATGKHASGGAIFNGNIIGDITGDFINNSALGETASGGAIYNSTGGYISGYISGDFIGNSAIATNGEAFGGAIENWSPMYLLADGSNDSSNMNEQDVLFQGNYTQSGTENKKYEAIYNTSWGDIYFESRNGGSFTFYDSITNHAVINLTGDDNIGFFNMYNNIEGTNSLFNSSDINIKNPYIFNMINQKANTISAQIFNIDASSKLNIDVVLQNSTSDYFNIYKSITGADNFSINQINFVDEMAEDVEYEKISYSNKTLTKESTHELSTSENVYSIVNDGKNLLIEKTDGVGGFAAFLANSNNLEGKREYSFTKDEEMRHALVDGIDKTGDVQGKKAKLTILGNNKTLTSDGQILSSMNLKNGKKAEINDLTIKGFETGLMNSGDMILNNVTLKNNKLGIKNSSKISFQGINVISGGDYSIYLLNDTTSSEKTYEYPLTGAYMDIMLAQQAADSNMSYEQYMAEMAKSMGVEVTNGAEFIESLKELGVEVPESDREFLNETLSTNLTDAQYNEIIDVVKVYGEEHSAGFMALMLTMEYPMIPLGDMMAILYAEDTVTQEALIDEFIEKMIASGEITEEDKLYAKQEISSVVSGAQQEINEVDTMYADLGIPSPFDYIPSISIEPTLNFAEGSILNLNSKVSGDDTYSLTLAGSDDAIINLNSEIEKADLVLDGPTLKLSDESTNLASVNSFEVKNGTLDLQNDAVRTLIASNFKVSGALKLFVDADLANKQMDTLGEVEVLENGSISVDGIKILSDAAEVETSVEFAEESYKDKVSTTVDNVLSTDYEYTIEYDTTTGEFKFVRGNKIASEEIAPNQAPSLTTNTTVATVETVVAQIFERDVTISTDINYGSDTPYSSERVSEEATSDGVNVHNNKSVWVKTFGSDDDVEVENFSSTIDAEAYGVVGGVDSKVFTYDNGVKAAYGIYGAYVGGKQKYDDNKITQDSGYLGISAAFRKNNLFSNFTLNGGYITSEANTEWGKDEFDTKVVSVANKTGVDIKAGNNWTVTPAMYVAYTGMDTEDYTNKAGVKMENEFANVITLAPELKVRKGFNNGVGAYAKASYKHYIYDSEVKADDVVLEEMSAKPYVEYGFGVEKNWADKSGYAEITRRDGGREGWNVNLGLKLDF